MCEKFPSLLYLLSFFPDTLRSRLQICLSLRSTCKVSQKCGRKCHRSIRERELSQKSNLCLWGAWKFPQRNRRTEKCREFLPQKFNGIPGAGGGYSFTLAIWVCASVAPKSTVFQISNLYCKTIISS